VSRVPQPYYTSLSAVTSPVLVPRPTARPDTCAKPDGAELGLPTQNFLGPRRRTTSPGRIWPAALVGLHGCSASHPGRGSASRRGNEFYLAQNSAVSGHTAVDAFATEWLVCGHDRAVADEQIQAPLLPDRPLDHVGSHEPEDICEATVEAVIGGQHSSDVVVSEIEITRVRSHTLPSKVHLSSKDVAVPAAEFSNSMQQSRSLSFTGVLSRMSPKSIRRLFSSTHHGTPKPGLECKAVINRDASRAVPLSSDVTKEHSFKKDLRRSTLGWFKARRRSKDDELGDRDPSKSGHVDAEIEPPSVQSIPDGCRTTPMGGKSSSKSLLVHDAALGLVTQPLYVVEFPDDVDVSPFGALLCNGDCTSALSPSLLDCVGQSEQNSIPIKQGKQPCPVNVSRYRQLPPPASLEVSAVHKMTKPIFRFPTSSPESIGRCSLDASYSADTGRILHHSAVVFIFVIYA